MKRASIDRVLKPLNDYISKSATSGILLFIAALSAIVMANIPATAEMYHHLWEIKFTIGFEPYAISKNLHHWINDGLMSIFFFVVGLELKREIMAGELSSPKD
ncbi:MAG TPA: Na+/H+ antiporter NhaA, partial [Chitinophagales bacterium]|nr:Na+/H+ antiporter NhaA [Chitinophagales bacterium]